MRVIEGCQVPTFAEKVPTFAEKVPTYAEKVPTFAEGLFRNPHARNGLRSIAAPDYPDYPDYPEGVVGSGVGWELSAGAPELPPIPAKANSLNRTGQPIPTAGSPMQAAIAAGSLSILSGGGRGSMVSGRYRGKDRGKDREKAGERQ